MPSFTNAVPSQLSGSAAAVEPDLGARLLDSLRGLSNESAAACQSSEAGQELFRVVQNLSPPPPPAPAAISFAATPQFLALPAPATAQFLPVGEPVRLTSASLGTLPAPAAPSPRDEDADSEEGVPHRLPPGFGAIPEDIIEERARQREEQRILQLKATQPCRFGRKCKRRDCPNAHPEGRDIDTALNPCAFGIRCKRKGCFYDHPEGRLIDQNPTQGMCKYGARCSRADCLYDHPPDRVPIAGPDPRICFFCHDTGHVAGDCPRNPDSWNYKPHGDNQPKAITAGPAEGSEKTA